MAKVLGLGGVFFQVSSPEATRAWYARVLGIEAADWGVMFPPLPKGGTVWSPFAQGSKSFAPSTLPWRINFVVDDLAGVLERVRAEGVEILEESGDDTYGRFAWLLDPDGIKIELWEPTE